MPDPGSLDDFSEGGPILEFSSNSPTMPRSCYGDSPEFVEKKFPQNVASSVELSLENGIEEVNSSALCENLGEEFSPEASFELLPQVAIQEDSLPVVNINAGSTDGIVVLGGVRFLQDNCFRRGKIARTDAKIGTEEDLSLYQTARVGNFSYHFQSLASGNYIVDLHFAEFVFTHGPPGMRVFDIFIQEQKVVSCLDVYARVGANKSLVISDIKASVDSDDCLFIRFEGVIGTPMVCGISIRKTPPTNLEKAGSVNVMGKFPMAEHELLEGDSNSKVEERYHSLQRDYECQKKELMEAKGLLEELKRENHLKSREFHEARKSLDELRNELMRKSMHVGSLAFAVEGQVKEKGRWFSSLRDLARKLKILKMEHIKLSEETLAYQKCFADMNEVSSMIQLKINQQADFYEDLKIKFIEGTKERKDLYNKVLELKGNIRVFCRCRPLNNEEIAAGASLAVDFEHAKDGELTVTSNGGAPKKTFKFDAVFHPEVAQGDVFEDTAPFATSVLDGYNVCIFAYGQTGSGKTFTMEGTDEARGVNFRTLQELFRLVKERQSLYKYDISVCVLEVYNEQIRDLLVPTGVAVKRLEIKHVSEGFHPVPGLVEAPVNNVSEAWEVLKTGTNARAVSSTNANEHSSRSHCIHCVMVKGENLLNGECTRSKLWLVDLAGSERVAKTEVQGERLKETQNINRSLSALGDVVSALATKSPHIPFRNSKLTHLLQDSLGGDSKTLMFVQISPNENDLSETICSLNFASRVRGIELGAAKKQPDITELLRNKLMVERNKQEIKTKDVHIKKLEETIHSLDMKMKERDIKNKNLQDKVKELESQLMVERKLARQHVDTKIAMQQQQHTKQYEEQNYVPTRLPLESRPLTENNYKPPLAFPTIDGFGKYTDPTEKENNPEAAEQPLLLLPKKTGRASICPMARRIPIAPALRRNSLIPFPSATQFPPQVLPSSLLCQTDESEALCLPEQTPCDSPKGVKTMNRKLSSILRRSLQKKVQMKSPMQQHMRKGGVNVGMEKVRVSIGSRGRMGNRVLLGNGRRGLTKEIQQKQHNHKEKERGWNIGTTGRTVI